MDLSWSLIAAAAWVIVGAVVALLPMRWQYPPGFALLGAAPLIVGWIAVEHGLWVTLLSLAAFVSMFRNPLRYFWQRARGEKPQMPT